MSEPTEKTDKSLEISDLPPEETLTPEEKERLAGAGRLRPTVEALEAREMMDATGLGGAGLPLSPPSNAAHIRRLDAGQGGAAQAQAEAALRVVEKVYEESGH